MDLPRDIPFWVEDAYGDLKFVRFSAHYTATAPARFGPFFAVEDSDGELLSREDIMAWSFDRTELGTPADVVRNMLSASVAQAEGC